MFKMSTQSLESVVRTLVNRLVIGDYENLLQQCSTSRLTGKDLSHAINDYGRQFIEPPPGAYTDLDAVAVRDALRPTWSVRVPLWSEEEGRSDLALEVTIIQEGDRWEIHLEDLHVL
jgi:hypothetical protein